MIKLKKINFNSKNFDYYFKIIFFFRNDNDYCKINKIKKIPKKDSYLWLKNNHQNRLFFIIKHKSKNIGIFNFNKIEKTFSQVIKKKYRDKGFGKKSFELLLNYLRMKNFKIITTFALKKNISSYKLHSFYCYKKKLLKNNFTKFYINCRNFQNSKGTF